MHMLHHGPYWAWITIEGNAADVYDVQHSGNLITCWIPSEAGKKFAINWFNSTRDMPLKATVYIDGVLCDTHVMLDAHNFPNKPNGIGISYARTSEYTRRDFMFEPIQVTDDDSLLDRVDDTKDLGVIKLNLWRINVTRVTTRVQGHESGRRTLEAHLVHERSKKAGSHHVQFGQEYASPAPMIDAVQAKEIDAKPFLTFEFKYRPLSLLIANDIAPKILHMLSPTPGVSELPTEQESKGARVPPVHEAPTNPRQAKRRNHVTLPTFRVKRIKTEVIDLT